MRLHAHVCLHHVLIAVHLCDCAARGLDLFGELSALCCGCAYVPTPTSKRERRASERERERDPWNTPQTLSLNPISSQKPPVEPVGESYRSKSTFLWKPLDPRPTLPLKVKPFLELLNSKGTGKTSKLSTPCSPEPYPTTLNPKTLNPKPKP